MYDGQSFDIIRENEVFGGGDFTTNYIQGSGIEFTTGEVTGGRYRYIEDGATDGRYRNIDGYSVEKTRFTGTKAALYANGESVGVNRFSSNGDGSGRAYFGTDILGSVRSATSDGASIEDRYEYDAFGTPYKGDFSAGLDGGYTGKPYDQTTGLYNYGYRDYNPQTARFTTVDPIRDGNNWFSYVVNDPVNYVDLWGLSSSDNSATDGVSQTWVAAETVNMTGGEFRLGNEGVTYNAGTASVIFSKQGSSDFFMAEYDVLSTASKGIFISAGTSSTTTIYTATFDNVPPNSAEAEQFIKESFTGGFRTSGFSVSIVPGVASAGFGKTVTIDPKTEEIDENLWSGKANAMSFGFGIDFSVGVVESVYKLKDQTWDDVAEHFTLGK